MVDMVELPSLTVPLPDGTEAKINQLPVTKSKKTLGAWMNPAGNCSKQLKVIHDVTEKWANQLSAGRLHVKWAWVSYFHQLWAKIRYGLRTNSLSVEELVAEEADGAVQTHLQDAAISGCQLTH